MTLLLGIVGSLVGVIIGAFLTRWLDSGYQRRQEIREAVLAALNLREELRDAAEGLRIVANDRKHSRGFLFARLDTVWDEERAILLAAGMSHTDWTQLAITFRSLLEVTTLLKNAGEGELTDKNAAFIKELCEECDTGQALLAPFVVDTGVPLLLPDAIFEPNRRGSRIRTLRWELWRRRRQPKGIQS
jgi:hypothetical protein